MVGAFPVMGGDDPVMHAFAGDKIRAQGKEQTGKKAKAEKEAAAPSRGQMAIRTVASFNMEHEFYETYQKQVDRSRG